MDDTQTLAAAAEVRLSLDHWNLPFRMYDGVIAYVVHGQRPGHFLTALFRNDFMEIMNRGDAENVSRLTDWAKLLYNDLPVGCWGSQAKVEAWKGLNVLRSPACSTRIISDEPGPNGISSTR